MPALPPSLEPNTFGRCRYPRRGSHPLGGTTALAELLEVREDAEFYWAVLNGSSKWFSLLTFPASISLFLIPGIKSAFQKKIIFISLVFRG